MQFCIFTAYLNLLLPQSAMRYHDVTSVCLSVYAQFVTILVALTFGPIVAVARIVAHAFKVSP